ncbi:MAG: NADH dehydrogenase [Parvicellaceae bacterium]|jgi:NADH dehydrogenase
MNIPKLKIPRLVILGGGFAGLKLARQLNSSKVQIVLIDRNNYHNFQPLMYQVATAGLEPDSIAYPLRKILGKKKNTHIRIAEINQVDDANNCIETSIGTIEYDYLVIATGACTNFFGQQEIEKYAMPMKTLTESLDLRSLILQNFEKALNSENIEEQNSLMNFVIVGGGPTGVELAGAFAELKKHILPNDYPDLDIRRMQIHLVEASPNVLNAMSELATKKATQFLDKMGVNIWTDTKVESYDGHMALTSKKNFKTETLIWAAGVKGAMVNGLDLSHLSNGRIEVDEFSQVKGYDNIFAVGDVSLMTTSKHPKGLPMLGSIAQQQGKHLAKNLKRVLSRKSMIPFSYKDKGTMATIGRNKAVVDLPRFSFSGFFAWMAWMFVHLMLLVDFRSRIVVFVNWTWSYIRFDKGTRVIVRKYVKAEDFNKSKLKKAS